MITEVKTEFMQSIPRTGTIQSFRFRAPRGVHFRPGQFFQLFLDGEGQELSHYFSFSNSPTERGYLEFTKRLSGSSFSRALLALRPQAPVRMKLPLGKFIFMGEDPRVAFLSGGIGITPIRSICRYLTDMSSPAEVTVLYSARSSEDLIFRDDFQQMQNRNPHLRMIYTITDAAPPEGWKGRIGRISALMVQEEIPDYPRRRFFVCGPPPMVAALTGMLKEELKVPSEQVILENFVGY